MLGPLRPPRGSALRSALRGIDGLFFPRICPVCELDRLDARAPEDLRCDPFDHPLHVR